jgi:hypothetical protein
MELNDEDVKQLAAQIRENSIHSSRFSRPRGHREADLASRSAAFGVRTRDNAPLTRFLAVGVGQDSVVPVGLWPYSPRLMMPQGSEMSCFTISPQSRRKRGFATAGAYPLRRT